MGRLRKGGLWEILKLMFSSLKSGTYHITYNNKMLTTKLSATFYALLRNTAQIGFPGQALVNIGYINSMALPVTFTVFNQPGHQNFLDIPAPYYPLNASSLVQGFPLNGPGSVMSITHSPNATSLTVDISTTIQGPILRLNEQ